MLISVLSASALSAPLRFPDCLSASPSLVLQGRSIIEILASLSARPGSKICFDRLFVQQLLGLTELWYYHGSCSSCYIDNVASSERLKTLFCSLLEPRVLGKNLMQNEDDSDGIAYHESRSLLSTV
ncbi:hypothetical protein BDR22DRAFT_535350 [Usnea florida]